MTDRPIGRRGFLCGASVAACVALSGCQTVRAANGSRKRVATFCCDVTPALGTPIYSSFKPLATIEHPLLAKGVVLEDGTGRYVLCAVDWCELCNSTHTFWRRKIAEAAGVDVSHVAVQTVHQHTAPIADGDAMTLAEHVPSPPVHPTARSFEEPAERVAAAVKQSLDALKPFNRIGVGQGKVDRVASNRRVPIGDGKVGFRASSCKDPKFIELPEGLIDPMLKTITFSNDTQPLVRLHYYATHPQSFYGDPRASYDFPGIARERLQQKEGVSQIYFTGCAGNIAAGKYNDGTPPVRAELADRLYAGMEASVASTVFMLAGALQWRTTPLLLTPREDGEYAEAPNRAILADPSLSALRRIGAAGNLSFHARRQIPIELSSLQIGDVHILHLAGEAMIEYQLDAQQLNPKAFIAVAAYGDCGIGYVCLEKSFPEGGYEPSASLNVPTFEKAYREAIKRLVGEG